MKTDREVVKEDENHFFLTKKNMETIIKLYLFVFRVGLTCGETDMRVKNGAKWEKYIGVCERILDF